MRKLILIALALGMIGMVLIPVLAEAEEGEAAGHAYIGVKRCGMCHKGDKNGNILETWEAGPHAKAYATLASEEAKAAYTEMGKEGNPQEDPACLKCHVTGHGADAALTGKLDMANGISCEACHGAGGDYWKKNIMEDREQSIANGMVAAPKEHCVSCHNEESPTFKGFEVEEYYSKIIHSLPEGE
ncbi:cytochrome c family protein [bacterium]|nr:cytochrome c family protein [bacterium]